MIKTGKPVKQDSFFKKECISFYVFHEPIYPSHSDGEICRAKVVAFYKFSHIF